MVWRDSSGILCAFGGGEGHEQCVFIAIALCSTAGTPRRFVGSQKNPVAENRTLQQPRRPLRYEEVVAHTKENDLLKFNFEISSQRATNDREEHHPNEAYKSREYEE